MPNQEQLRQESLDLARKLIRENTPTIKQIDEENLLVIQREQKVRIKLNPNIVRSQTTNF